MTIGYQLTLEDTNTGALKYIENIFRDPRVNEVIVKCNKWYVKYDKV